jgi:hypothetical protein
MSPRHLPLAALLLALGLGDAEALQAPIVLAPGSVVTVDLPARAASNSYVIDVPAGAEHLRVELKANDPRLDLDLLLRADAAFDLRTEGGVDVQQLFDQAHYRSASAGGDEFLLIGTANPIPLKPGRWHLGLINFESQPVPARLSVSFDAPAPAAIEMVFDAGGSGARDCDTSGWNDPSPRPAVAGNPGTTLGEQRRNAAREAARLLTEQLRPRAPVRVRACWDDLGDASGDRFTLAQAGPENLFVSDVGFGSLAPALARPYTWYASAAAAQQLGTSGCRIAGGDCAADFDVQATFNNRLDVEGAARFDYGIGGSGGAGSSFVSVAMHEIAHGLGIFGLINLEADEDGPVGARLSLFNGAPLWDDIYGARVVSVNRDGLGFSEFLRIDDAERAATLATPWRPRFAGPEAVALAATQNFAPPDNFIRLHAPNEIAPGSTYSHIGSLSRYGIQLMYASIGGAAPRDLGLAAGMLADLGWSNRAASAPAFSTAPSFQFYDPSRSGHGIDFRLIAPAISGRPAEYFLGFYTFDESGEPEWYIASGPVIDGVFVPKRNAFGDSLLRQRYLGPGASVADDSAGYAGSVRIDFNAAALHPACSDGDPRRALDGPLAVFTARINGERLQWCMQPVVRPQRVQRDFSSIWNSPGDGGWGLALQSFDGFDTDGLFSILFYADGNGQPRWAIGQVTDFRPGEAQPLRQVSGFCRSCAAPAALTLSEPIGSVQLDLVQGGAGAQGNRVSFEVAYPGTPAQRFSRSEAQLFPNSDPTLEGASAAVD